jgi:hemerythrin-like domain-containing protein
MLRDKNLIPLSHQHQHALALCVRIERASPIPVADLDTWQTEIAQTFQSEISIHFVAEEEVVFPAAMRFAELTALVDQLLQEHSDLRARFAESVANKMSGDEVSELARRLSAHIRKEERELFEGLQRQLSSKELDLLGQQLTQALKDAVQSCAISTDVTRLKAKN